MQNLSPASAGWEEGAEAPREAGEAGAYGGSGTREEAKAEAEARANAQAETLKTPKVEAQRDIQAQWDGQGYGEQDWKSEDREEQEGKKR